MQLKRRKKRGKMASRWKKKFFLVQSEKNLALFSSNFVDVFISYKWETVCLKIGVPCRLKIFRSVSQVKKKLNKFFIFQNGFRLVCGWRNCKSFIVALWYERGWKNKRRFTFIFEFLQLFRLLIKIHWATLSNLSKKMFVFHIFIFWFSKEKEKI